ncbi:putative nucleotidyltransferase [compost metagenome]
MKMDMPVDLRNAIMELLEIKKNSDEKAEGTQIPIIQEFIESEIVKQKVYVDSIADDRNAQWQKLNDIFIKTLE